MGWFRLSSGIERNPTPKKLFAVERNRLRLIGSAFKLTKMHSPNKPDKLSLIVLVEIDYRTSDCLCNAVNFQVLPPPPPPPPPSPLAWAFVIFSSENCKFPMVGSVQTPQYSLEKGANAPPMAKNIQAGKCIIEIVLNFTHLWYQNGKYYFTLTWCYNCTVEPCLSTILLIRPPCYYDHLFVPQRN